MRTKAARASEGALLRGERELDGAEVLELAALEAEVHRRQPREDVLRRIAQLERDRVRPGVELGRRAGEGAAGQRNLHLVDDDVDLARAGLRARDRLAVCR